MGLPQYSSSNVLNVDHGTKLQIIAKGVLKAVKTAKGDVLKRSKELDNPLIQSSSTIQYLTLISKMAVYRRKNGISYHCAELLLYVYFLYLESNTAVTSYGIVRLFSDCGSQASEVQSCRNKLNRLVNHGMLIMVGINSNGGMTYIPSDKAINDISDLINK